MCERESTVLPLVQRMIDQLRTWRRDWKVALLPRSPTLNRLDPRHLFPFQCTPATENNHLDILHSALGRNIPEKSSMVDVHGRSAMAVEPFSRNCNKLWSLSSLSLVSSCVLQLIKHILHNRAHVHMWYASTVTEPTPLLIMSMDMEVWLP